MNRAVSSWIVALMLVGLAACGGEENAAAKGSSTGVAEDSSSNASTGDLANAYHEGEPATAAMTGVASRAGDIMPEYSANDLVAGGTWNLSDQKGVTMLNLWATWCGPCRYEIPALIELQEEFGDKGFQVVGVSMDRSGMEPQITAFVRSAGINYKIVHDPRARLADVFNTTIIPTTALIDKDGKILWYHAGIVSGDDPDLRAALESVL